MSGSSKNPPYQGEAVKKFEDPLTRPCERLSSVHPSPRAGPRELNLMFTFPSPQRGEGPGVGPGVRGAKSSSFSI